jgi:hypothetical protein
LRIDDGSTSLIKVAIDTKNTNDNNLFAEMIGFTLSDITCLLIEGFLPSRYWKEVSEKG